MSVAIEPRGGNDLSVMGLDGARTLWYLCRRLLLKSRLFNRIVFTALTQPARLEALKRLRRGHWSGIPLVRPSELRQRLSPQSETCHIIGAGWSLNTSKFAIGPDDFVIGFNFAALTDLRFDLYLCELHTRSDKRRVAISALQERLIKDNHGSRIRELCFHSPWLGFLDAGLVLESYGSDVRCLSDYQLSSHYIDVSEHMREVVAERLLKPDPNMSGVVATTTVTAIGLAYQLGFRTIVVHGLDGGGAYFFDVPGFEMPRGFEAVRDFYPQASGATTTTNYSGAQGLRLIPALRDALRRRGVDLLAGCAESPASTHLRVYAGSRI